MKVNFEPFTVNCKVLNRVDLEFFYYCVCNEKDDNMLNSVDWDNQIKPLLDEKGIEVNFVAEKDKVAPCNCNNSISLSLYRNENKTISFFRHLRNSFAHYRISHLRKNYILNDEHNGKITMSGKIEARILKDIVLKVLETKERTYDAISAFTKSLN